MTKQERTYKVISRKPTGFGIDSLIPRCDEVLECGCEIRIDGPPAVTRRLTRRTRWNRSCPEHASLTERKSKKSNTPLPKLEPVNRDYELQILYRDILPMVDDTVNRVLGAKESVTVAHLR